MANKLSWCSCNVMIMVQTYLIKNTTMMAMIERMRTWFSASQFCNVVLPNVVQNIWHVHICNISCKRFAFSSLLTVHILWEQIKQFMLQWLDWSKTFRPWLPFLIRLMMPSNPLGCYLERPRNHSSCAIFVNR